MTINEIFTEAKKLNVIVVGDSMLDSYKIGNVTRQSPEAEVPIVDIENKSKKLGGAANVILNLKYLGVNPILCSVIGDDESGRKLTSLLKKNNLDTGGIIIDKSRKTTVKERVIVKKKHILRIDEEIKKNLNDRVRKKLLKKIESYIENSDILIFQDYNKGVIDKKLLKGISYMKKIFISVDPKIKNFTDFKNIDLFKPNLKEISSALEIEAPTIKNLEVMGKKLMKKNHIDNLMITLSERGIIIITKESVSKFEIYESEIVDVSGAGDAIISLASILFYLNLPLSFIGKMCNVAGGIVCMHSGVKAINCKELIEKAKRYKLDLYL